MNPLFTSKVEGEAWFVDKFGTGKTYDAVARELHIWEKPVLLLYINGLVDGQTITTLLTEMQEDDASRDTTSHHTGEKLLSYFPYHAVEQPKSREELLTSVLSGLAAFIADDGFTFVIDVREYPGRQPEEPDNEKVIRGSRDGFTENILQNTTLIRRRLRTPELRFEMHQVSANGKTDIAISYINGAASEHILDGIRKRLDEIETDGLTMTDKSLEEFLFKQRFNPMPFVRYTERPDICAAHLLEGRIALVVDTSPSAILVPTTIFDHLQHAEEYRQAPFIGTFVRMIRLLGSVFSLLLLPFWYLLATKSEHIPQFLHYIGPDDPGAVPLFVQLLLADLGIEILRMAAIHTPTPMTTAMGLVAAIVIGQVAIDVGLFTPEVVLYVSVSAILTFAIPSYELSITTKIFRIALLTAAAAAGAPGFFIMLAVLFYYLSSMKPINVPYLWPAVPFFPVAMARIILRLPMTEDMPRPYITHSPKRNRMP